MHSFVPNQMENDCDQCIGKYLEEEEWDAFKSDISEFNKKEDG
jgi:hypothetical protein